MTNEHVFEDEVERDQRATRQTPYPGDDDVKERLIRSAKAFQASWDDAELRGPTRKTTGPFGDTTHIVPVSGADIEPAVPDPIPPRRQLLEESANLIDGDRNKNYGSPVSNFSNTAKLLNARFEHMFKDGEQFSAADVATIQMLVKISRMVTSPDKKDHWLDIVGYAGCGWECVEDANS